MAIPFVMFYALFVVFHHDAIRYAKISNNNDNNNNVKSSMNKIGIIVVVVAAY